MPVTLVHGVAALADAHELFLVDQWGVLHDGHRLYPGAADALRGLKDAGRTVILLSNSGKRPGASGDRLDQLGIPPSLYDAVVTSGGQLHDALARAESAPYDALGERVFVFAWDADRGLLEGLPYREVTDLREADWILCAGVDRPDLPAYADDLVLARERGLPLLVANPDFVTVAPDGSLQLCPGSIARAYEEQGGIVHWHGKPTAGIYEACRRVGGSGPALGIGDSLHHDVAGAADAGMATLLVTGGIHAEELPADPDAAAVEALARRLGTPVPDYASFRFRW